MIRYLIIDDEPIAHRIIENYGENLPHLVKVGNCYNAFEAMQVLNESAVDLLFLDINMPKLSGFDFLKSLASPPKIIVTTAYKEFALEGYELNISDYLLKPFSFERFIKAINKTIDASPNKKSMANLITETKPDVGSFFLKGDKKHHQIHFEDLLFVEAYGHFTKVYLKDDMIISSQKISDFEKMLPTLDFLRIHKSFIVSKNKIRYIEGNRVLIDQHKIPIGQTYKENINKFF
ncbi:LytR/AlgR family response regulator transcription factor [Pedobacter alluvionis]|uniref:LytTR family two component transcriptional regulator n=1 Tax=Pedobacter alluvionis TaxID=475253 RepID=A0A497YGI3_9SPHI|nr:LytTR family DNA-binding domain-containing protein [Pedobacter alluvionis]RLJ80479.1 LytTR family two component transcriptional regulator [Pedobacter alluvionis]TFB31751.1 response regulator transcription factor [Pedobacter alluvionis]